MAHQIETMMYAAQTPWHGLGTFVGDENVFSDVAIQKAGLDWKVEKQPLFLGNGNQLEENVATVRDTDSAVLGIVGTDYQVLQNSEAFNFMDSLVDAGDMRYHTAGSLSGGRRVWLLGQIDSTEVVPGDRIDQFVFLYNSHDGSSALRCLWTDVRVVCANTARMALGKAKSSDGIAIRHTLNMEARMAEAQKVLGIARSAASLSAERYKALARENMKTAAWQEFLNNLIPDRDLSEIEVTGKRKPSNTRRNNQREDLTKLFEAGLGQDIAGVAGTKWAAYNAVTEYVNHHSSVKTTGRASRMENVMFGVGNGMAQRALELLSA